MSPETHSMGDKDPRIYLVNREPTPRSQRPTDQYILKIATEAGWPKDEDVLVDFLAVLLAESNADSRGYLAYIDIGADRHKTLGLQRRELIDLYAENSPGVTLTTFRHEIHELVPRANVVRADIGLMQLGKTFPGWRREKLNEAFTVAMLVKPTYNLEEAYRLWLRRGFQPWAAYTTPRGMDAKPPFEQFHDRAWGAVQKFLKEE